MPAKKPSTKPASAPKPKPAAKGKWRKMTAYVDSNGKPHVGKAAIAQARQRDAKAAPKPKG